MIEQMGALMDVDEALRRIKLIAPMLRQDVGTAVASHSVMEACNDVIPRGMNGIHTVYNDTYGIVQNALALKLAMDIARIFDVGQNPKFPPETQDKASVQVLGALFEIPGVKERLQAEASNWLPGIEDLRSDEEEQPSPEIAAIIEEIEAEHRAGDRETCSKTITAYLEIVARLSEVGSHEEAAIKRVRDFRNRRLAHSLFDKEPDALPMYSDLNLLLALAMDAAKHASLIVEGLNTEFDEQADRDRSTAEGYAACVLQGLRWAESA
ncbi:hypothetical protein [Rhizobium sp. LCM 4573]|uniref:AbiU2 domain-containing protein n=1 Tax=Rhizobium sp. LCM 4573 TaxID=1848291 RepID=UPI0008DAACB1|nr:hypothetical protein [Rhizobium sp. LCM 4573]OHV82623.1 hypothetical protein LCM4573_16640 [Rhizobium sp. LCM 4573]